MRRAARDVREGIRRTCRTEQDPVALHRAVAAQLQPAVPFDRWCGLILDPATLLVTGGYHAEGLPPKLLPRLVELEAADADVNGMPALARTRSGVSTIDRATAGRPGHSQRFREVLEPGGLGREMRAVLRDRTSSWGGIILMRETTAPDFSDRELTLLAGVAGDLARGLRRCLLLSELANRNVPDVPGILLIAPGGFEVEVASSAGRRWLAEVDDGVIASGLPLAVGGLIARARQRADRPARARLRTRSGRWLTAYAEVVEPSRQGRVSVVVEPTRPHELAAIIADAYALTQRERDVARLVIAGHSNQEIAGLLFLSPWTVQDHLKRVFDKVGVHSRSELTSRMFFGHYLPRAIQGKALAADGWYLDS